MPLMKIPDGSTPNYHFQYRYWCKYTLDILKKTEYSVARCDCGACATQRNFDSTHYYARTNRLSVILSEITLSRVREQHYLNCLHRNKLTRQSIAIISGTLWQSTRTSTALKAAITPILSGTDDSLAYHCRDELKINSGDQISRCCNHRWCAGVLH